MERILVSACLLGAKVRYDGRDALVPHPALRRWAEEGRLIPVCPEQLGGLPTPRPAAELVNRGGRLRVVTAAGDDVSGFYEEGARQAVAAAGQNAARIAILKDRSPSCGSSVVYDGSFSERGTPGEGLTTTALRRAGVRVFSEQQIDEAAAYLAEIERK